MKWCKIVLPTLKNMSNMFEIFDMPVSYIIIYVIFFFKSLFKIKYIYLKRKLKSFP